MIIHDGHNKKWRERKKTEENKSAASPSLLSGGGQKSSHGRRKGFRFKSTAQGEMRSRLSARDSKRPEISRKNSGGEKRRDSCKQQTGPATFGAAAGLERRDASDWQQMKAKLINYSREAN